MRKIIVGAQMSLDGVMQSPGGQTEDPTRFKFGGWAMPYWNQTTRQQIMQLFGGDFDLLFGRKTYEIFAAYWPYQDDTSPRGEIAKLFNRVKKYVVSRSGEVDTSWPETVLLRDLAEVRRLREENGGSLITQGSTVLAQALFANDLVDAFDVFTMPIVVGSGKKLFANGALPRAFTHTGTRISDLGVVMSRYERAGEIKIGDAGLDNPSKAELARRERLKREG